MCVCEFATYLKFCFRIARHVARRRRACHGRRNVTVALLCGHTHASMRRSPLRLVMHIDARAYNHPPPSHTHTHTHTYRHTCANARAHENRKRSPRAAPPAPAARPPRRAPRPRSETQRRLHDAQHHNAAPAQLSASRASNYTTCNAVMSQRNATRGVCENATNKCTARPHTAAIRRSVTNARAHRRTRVAPRPLEVGDRARKVRAVPLRGRQCTRGLLLATTTPRRQHMRVSARDTTGIR